MHQQKHSTHFMMLVWKPSKAITDIINICENSIYSAGKTFLVRNTEGKNKQIQCTLPLVKSTPDHVMKKKKCNLVSNIAWFIINW